MFVDLGCKFRRNSFRSKAPNTLRFRSNRPESGSVQFCKFRCFVHQNHSRNTTKIRPENHTDTCEGSESALLFRSISITVNRLEQVSIDLIPCFIDVTLKQSWMRQCRIHQNHIVTNPEFQSISVSETTCSTNNKS